MILKYQTYVKEFQENNEYGLYFIENQLQKHLQLNEENQTEIEHILDYVYSTKKKFKVGYKTIKEKSRKWSENLQKEHVNDDEKEGEDYEVLKKWSNGYKVVKLVSENSYKREGKLMSHCVSSYYGRSLEVYSLRCEKNLPHATMEKDNQIKGKGNGSIIPKYIKYVVEFLEEIGMDVRDEEMENLGYINIQKLKREIQWKELDLFKGKYIYKENFTNIKNKKGEEYHSFKLWDIKGLFDFDFKLKFKFNIDIDSTIQYIKNKSDYAKLASSGDYAKLASSGDYAKLASSGYSAKLASSGDYAKLASSGNSAELASSGDYAKLASSGDSAELASSGYSAELASSGDYAKLASSGNSAELASSGDYAKLASSGDYAKLASSGYSAKLASSGDYAKLASSGYSAKLASSGYSAELASSGEKSVVAAIGINNKAKAKKGSWITLAEYDEENEIKFVKTEHVDGVNIKEDTWYKLEGNKFTETNV